MHVLGFIHVKSRSTVEEELITEVWKMVLGTNDNYVKAENLFVLLCAVMNLQISEIARIHKTKNTLMH